MSLSLATVLSICHFFLPDGPSTDPALQQRYPILTDKDFVPAIHAELVNEGSWETPELFRTVQFAWGVLLREFARPGYTGKSTIRVREATRAAFAREF